MYPHLSIVWPSTTVNSSALARRLLTLAGESQFVEIGLAAAPTPGVDPAKDTISSIRRALQDAMETDLAEDHAEIAARMSHLLHAIADEGLSLTVTVEPRIVETGNGVGHIEVLSLVVAHPSPVGSRSGIPQTATA